jgi:sugar lactone lactonase YvrE
MTMQTDDDIRDRLVRSLRAVEPPRTEADPVIRRARSLRRRHRAVGALIAAVCAVALVVPLAVLWPLGARHERSETGPATEPGRLVVSARIPIAPGLTDVATGFGGVWLTGTEGVAHVDPATEEVVADIRVPGTGDYGRIAVGEGSVWVIAPELWPDRSRGNLVRIDPATDEVTATIHIGGPIQGLAVGDGSVWVTVPDEIASTLYRVDPTTERVTDTVRVGAAAGSVVFAEGSVWVNHEWGGGSVDRIDPATGAVVDELDVPNVQAAGAGSLWGVDGDAVLRIDPGSGEVLSTIPIPRAQQVAFDGSTVWVLQSPRSSDPKLFMPIAGTAGVVRIDPATDRVIGDPVSLEDLQPIALAVGEPGAWVVDYYDGFLSRIEPAG